MLGDIVSDVRLDLETHTSKIANVACRMFIMVRMAMMMHGVCVHGGCNSRW
jgi:hypothetical protein